MVRCGVANVDSALKELSLRRILASLDFKSEADSYLASSLNYSTQIKQG